MKFREALFWQPGALTRTGISAGFLVPTVGVGYLYTLTGLAYEFHVLFIQPVLLVAWFVGARAGYGLALLAAVERFIADRILEGAQADPFPLPFNTGMRLAILPSCATAATKALAYCRGGLAVGAMVLPGLPAKGRR